MKRSQRNINWEWKPLQKIGISWLGQAGVSLRSIKKRTDLRSGEGSAPQGGKEVSWKTGEPGIKRKETGALFGRTTANHGGWHMRDGGSPYAKGGKTRKEEPL